MSLHRARSDQPAVHVLHDNPDWIAVFQRAFDEQGIPFRSWQWHELLLALDDAPPRGVFWSG